MKAALNKTLLSKHAVKREDPVEEENKYFQIRMISFVSVFIH